MRARTLGTIPCVASGHINHCFGAAAGIAVLSACSSVPPFVLNGDNSQVAPAGPKVATLMGNMKCELWQAAHSDQTLPFYTDDPTPRIRNNLNAPKQRIFNLTNIFQEIEYVAEAQFTLDVTNTGAADPSIGISEAGTRELAAPLVKQRLAALRHLFDWLVGPGHATESSAHGARPAPRSHDRTDARARSR